MKNIKIYPQFVQMTSIGHLSLLLALSLQEPDDPGLGPRHELHHLATGASSQLGQLGLGQLKRENTVTFQ